MAVSGNDFEGGSNGATASTTSIASSGYGFRVLGAGSWKFTTDSAHGSLAIAFARASNNGYLDENSALNTPDITFSMFFRYKTALPNDNDWLFDARTASGSLVRMFTTATTGIPFLQVSGTTVWTGTTALIVNTWYRLDVRIHVNAASGFADANFYTSTGTSPLFTGPSFSGNTGSSNIVNVAYGPFGGNAVTVGTFEMDEPRFDATTSAAFLGPATPTQSMSVALTQSSTLSVSPALVRSMSVALTNLSILTIGSAIWDDWRYDWDDSRITWDDNTVIESVAFTNQSVLTFQVGKTSPIALTNDSILSVVAFAYSGDLALLVGLADLEWAIGDSDVEWTSASNPST